LVLAGILLVGTLLVGIQAAARPAPAAQFTDGGAERCLTCHAAESMTLMANTAHGDTSNPYTPYAQQGCESCHGPGSLHASRARGGPGRPGLTQFGIVEPPRRQIDACLSCHATDMGELPGMAWNGSMHDVGNITCSNCHRVHALISPIVDRDLQIEVCSACHHGQVADHPRFEDKGILFDKLICHDCHDVHQLMARD